MSIIFFVKIVNYEKTHLFSYFNSEINSGFYNVWYYNDTLYSKLLYLRYERIFYLRTSNFIICSFFI